jgi:hypothetical protein
MNTAVPVPRPMWDSIAREAYWEYPHIGSCRSSQCPCWHQFRYPWLQNLKPLRYSEAFSIEDAKRITTSYAKSIQDDFNYLRQNVAYHGNTIINRWKKRNRSKRVDTIRSAFPQIPESQWYPIKNVHDHPFPQNPCGPREATLLPYLSIEGLKTDPLRLLALIHARTAFGPEEWVTFDMDKILRPWERGRLRIEYAECCVVLHGPGYGDVVPWDKERAHRLDMIAFPMARPILEAQYLLMKFLKRIVVDILQGVDQSQRTISTKWVELVSSGFRGSLGVESWSICSNQAFHGPICNFKRLLDLAKSKLEDSDDELWLLQTDAAFFQHYMKKRAATQTPLDTSGHTRGWAFSREFLIHPVGWRWVVDELDVVCNLYSKYEDQIVLGQSLPEEFEVALSYLDALLDKQISGCRHGLRQVLLEDTSFQSCLSFENEGFGINGYVPEAESSEGIGLPGLFKKDPVLWCLYYLTSALEENSFDTSFLLDFLDHCLEKESTSANKDIRVGERLLSDLSHLATYHE